VPSSFIINVPFEEKKKGEGVERFWALFHHRDTEKELFHISTFIFQTRAEGKRKREKKRRKARGIHFRKPFSTNHPGDSAREKKKERGSGISNFPPSLQSLLPLSSLLPPRSEEGGKREEGKERKEVVSPDSLSFNTFLS